MPSLSLQQWARYEPSIPGNSALPVSERFYLEVAAGLSSMEFERYMATRQASVKLSTETERDAAIVAATAPLVRLGAVPLTLDGRPVETVEAYLSLTLAQCGWPLFVEVSERLKCLNSYEGLRELFSVRPSGGTASTPAPSAAPVGSQTAAP